MPNQSIFAGQTTATGISENDFASSINLFPNPANDKLTIAFGSINKKVEVNITDITGKVIYSTIASETQKIEVNTKDFAAGIYVVQIQSPDFIGTKKLIIEK
ncbi:MAG: T9SS type A sorting domain-containing protein [Bacteroidetes bacterium]|nr:T9SS type A sorting domain-containing protein [Bacteroidota bacterium]